MASARADRSPQSEQVRLTDGLVNAVHRPVDVLKRVVDMWAKP
jgi:hypothetical protein